jgi:hypothetical protein
MPSLKRDLKLLITLKKRAESVVTRQAEEFYSQISNAKIAFQLAGIEKLKDGFIQMVQS